jgi:formylglycine-generating enzyme required for sulfatase activity/tRNA A-37 threonylcarbamoyl transferase component Bud32
MGTRPDLEGMLLDGRYRVDQLVASGGFGDVYRGHHITLGTDVAIKTVRDRGLDTSAFEATLEEARATARLRHPHIASTLDAGLHVDGDHPRGLPWLALEWVEGESLKEHLAGRTQPMSDDECLALMLPITDAMAHAHEAGIVHRDIKPSNIMLAAGDGLSPRIVDFGIAKEMEAPSSPSGDTSTQSNARAFSPAYAAPEQLAAKRTGPWTDVHALGLLMTEMLTKRRPYADMDGTEDATHERCFSPERPTPSRFGVAATALEPIIAKAVALEPAARYADAGALHRALREFPARGEPPAPRRWTRRIGWFALPAVAAVGWVAWSSVPTQRTRSSPFIAPSASRDAAEAVPTDMRLISAAQVHVGSERQAIDEAIAACKASKLPPGLGDLDALCTSFEREAPRRRVDVAAFLIDTEEVNVGDFVDWLSGLEAVSIRDAPEGRHVVHAGHVIAGVEGRHGQMTASDGRFLAKPGVADRPVALVSWHGAHAYCAARGKRLPTEAEWVRAARGTESRTYAWGEDPPTCDEVVYGRLPGMPCSAHDAGPVDTDALVEDVTPDGVMGLGGNLREWVADRFTAKDTRVIRGCGWWELPVMCRAARRGFDDAEWVDVAVGFRCARDVESSP